MDLTLVTSAGHPDAVSAECETHVGEKGPERLTHCNHLSHAVTPLGWLPTGTVAATVFVPVSIT
jgi:hypothetical protein